jgi:probable phosphoglycerate mutase
VYLVRHGAAGPAPGGDANATELTDVGRQQAVLLGRRLAGAPLTAIEHSPLPRAAQTAALIGAQLPDVAVTAVDLLGDYVPAAPDLATLPPAYGAFLGRFPAAELAAGARLAAAALDRYARPPDPAGSDVHQLLVTHSFLVSWFVRHALDAPPARWLGLNSGNAALTVILYRADRPPTLLVFNDMAHLPPHLRWTGFPADLHV